MKFSYEAEGSEVIECRIPSSLLQMQWKDDSGEANADLCIIKYISSGH